MLLLVVLGLLAVAAPLVTLDGDFGEWPEATQVVADGQHIYLRLDLPEPVTLQENATEHQIRLDIDSDTMTARPGTDLTISFSGGKRRHGAAVTVHGRTGRQPRSHAAVGLMGAPTYAARSLAASAD